MATLKSKKTKIEDTVVGAYQKIEDTVVGTYQKIEDAVVGTYQKIETNSSRNSLMLKRR